jgi:small-conductance mechanosensitive channel
MWTELRTQAMTLWAHPYIRAATIALGAIVAAYLIDRIVSGSVGALVRRTTNDLDNRIIDALHMPIFLSVILGGLAWSLAEVIDEGLPRFIAYGCLRTLAIFVWTVAVVKIGSLVLHGLSARARPGSLLQPRTFPLLDILLKILILGAAAYFTFLAWRIDVTAWLASAGVVGIAVGFAAKDSLANLISGIFILADAPYKVGDWVVLEGDLRGMVRSIGMRSTRILTRDDVEITVPNSVMGNSKIINEAGGPHVKQRICTLVSVAYDSDIDHVGRVLLSCAEDVPGRCDEPAPEYRFRAFGASGLDFVLYVWILDPAVRERVISELNIRIFKRFRAEGIEIPYSKQDVYVKALPGAGPAPGQREDAPAQAAATGAGPRP